MKEREPGFYWARMKLGSDWEIIRWDEFEVFGCWEDSLGQPESEVLEWGPRLDPPSFSTLEEKPQPYDYDERHLG